MCLIAAALVAFGCQGSDQTPVLTGQERAELKTLTNQLAEVSRSPQTKLEAAGMLLAKPHEEATQALMSFIQDSTNPSGQLAIAQAIAQRQGADEAFIGPLLVMLEGDVPALRSAAGKALVAYRNESVTDRMLSIATAQDASQDVRLAAIESVGAVGEKSVVEAMVMLLDDGNGQIRDAATKSLSELTSIRAFGRDREKWKAWWAQNKRKKRSEWLSDLADRLARSVAGLETENAVLRGRLGKAMRDLYDTAPPDQQIAMLLSFLTDDVADVRLAGAGILDRGLSANAEFNGDVRSQIRSMLSDDDERCRRAAALLVATMGDGGSLDILIGRMEVETDPGVRQGILAALGQLKTAKALPVVLEELSSSDDAVSAAAAEALARISQVDPPVGKTRKAFTEALGARYAMTAGSGGYSKLREALLTAMGQVGDDTLASMMTGALSDQAATVRLAAVGALAKLQQVESAPALAALVSDEDRGVRQAAISALGSLDGERHLPIILERTAPEAEADSSVRAQAWEVAMAVLSGTDAGTLRSVADSLAGRSDATDRRIEVLQMLVRSLTDVGGLAEADARGQLATALIETGRPAEAATQLGQAWRLHQDAGSDEVDKAWVRWIDVLLATDDPVVVRAMDDEVEDEQFSVALGKLMNRLSQLAGEGNYSSVILLGSEAVKGLSHRMSAQDRQRIEALVSQAEQSQKDVVRQEIGRLIVQLVGKDQAASQAAATRLVEAGPMAAKPLLVELRKVISAEDPDANVEAIILSVAAGLGQDLSDYDVAAEAGEKARILDQHLKSLP